MFEQWWQQYVKPAHFYTVEQTAKEAWDYQQQRIDELEHKLALRDAFIAGLQFGKAQEQE